MEWDKIAMAQKFLQKANGIHPEDVESSAYARALAIQDLYYECYMTSFSKATLVSFLESCSSGNIKIPEDVNAEQYSAAYVREAASVLRELT
jgi:hypothetical protein